MILVLHHPVFPLLHVAAAFLAAVQETVPERRGRCCRRRTLQGQKPACSLLLLLLLLLLHRELPPPLQLQSGRRSAAGACEPTALQSRC
jgi:hypothetical protein